MFLEVLKFKYPPRACADMSSEHKRESIEGNIELKAVKVDELKPLIEVDEIARKAWEYEVQDFMDAMRGSIELYGTYPAPIHISSDGYVIDGIARVEAARRLGIKELPAIVHRIKCSEDKEKCFLLRVFLNSVSSHIGRVDVSEARHAIERYALEYIGALDEKSKKRLSSAVSRCRTGMAVTGVMCAVDEELLRSFLNYMVKKTGLPPSVIIYFLSD